MARTGKIQWRQKDFDEITKRVRAFNSAITRANKKYGTPLNYLPERLTVAGVRERITTRAEFNREMKALKRFNIQTAKLKQYPGGVVTTIWQADEARRLTRIVNRKRKAEAARMPKDPYEKGIAMGSAEANRVKPKVLDFKTMEMRDWMTFLQGVEKMSRDDYEAKRMQTYKSNYLKAITEQLGPAGEELYEYIEGVPASALYVSYYEDPFLQIQWLYDEHEAALVAERALERWKELIDE